MDYDLEKQDFGLSIFDLREGKLYFRHRVQNQLKLKLFKRVGDEMFVRDITPSSEYRQWSPAFNLKVKDRFMELSGGDQWK